MEKKAMNERAQRAEVYYLPEKKKNADLEKQIKD